MLWLSRAPLTLWRICQQLARHGYTLQHRFAILPFRTQPRWLLPLTSARRTIDGFELYTPYSRATRLMKALVVRVRATGWEGWVRHSVLIAARDPLPIEELATDVTGERHLTFAVSLGTPGPVQKLTVQVMRTDGKILGYLKMPLKPGAEQRLRHEADTIEKLQRFAKIRAHIPRLLFAGSWEGRFVVFQSAIEGEAGPVRMSERHEEILVHTGQHYDDELSQIFFEELAIPTPDVHLELGNGTNLEQTGRMMTALESELTRLRPDAVLVYGDTNTTLAAAVTAAHLRLPLIHVEAGMRSFDRTMPEEVNRVLTDHVSGLCLCSTPVAVRSSTLRRSADWSAAHTTTTMAPASGDSRDS